MTQSLPEIANDLRDRPAPTVKGKLRKALDIAVQEGLHFPDAARKAGILPAAIRKALAKPHVISYLRMKRKLFREEICSKNEHRLGELRDQNDNRMAAVAAIKTLEQLGDDRSRSGLTVNVITPGVVVDLSAKYESIIDETVIEIDAGEEPMSVASDG